MSYPRRLSQFPLVDQKRVCTSTCQPQRGRRALDINSWQVIRCRSDLLTVYIRFTNMRFISAQCRVLIWKWRCAVELENQIEKWSAVGSLSVIFFELLSSFQLYGALRHCWWSLFIRTGRIHVLSFSFRNDVLSYVTWVLCSYISHWSLHDPFVDFNKFVTSIVVVETPRDFIFFYFTSVSMSYSSR